MMQRLKMADIGFAGTHGGKNGEKMVTSGSPMVNVGLMTTASSMEFFRPEKNR
jgi:hypothetical protein